MIEARFVPLETWPGKPTPAHQRKRGAFKTIYVRMLDHLERELRHLRAKDILIQAFLRWEQIRNDGWPRASERPQNPGVVISFQSPTGALSFPSDRYTTMEHNIYAVSLCLEALRAVDRYGVTRRAEQYQGWKQIEAPTNRYFHTKEDAAAFVATQAYPAEHTQEATAAILRDPISLKAAYLRAAAVLHPDKGGNQELFVRLRQAMELLEGKNAA